jgi:signal transduction histidine kinase
MFLSYSVISCIVLFVYYRHARLVDTICNRLLVITAGMFLMLCACTHLYSTNHDSRSLGLSTSCAVVSLVSAICFLAVFKRLDGYLSLRVNTLDVIREELVRDLSDGYDLRGTFCGSTMVDGFLGGSEICGPIPFEGVLDKKSTIRIDSKHYRLTRVVQTSVFLGPSSHEFSPEDPHVREFSVFGYDATAEVHMANEQERINSVKMAMCMSTAHDVRTPLSSLGIVISCLQSMGNRDENIVEYDKLLDEAYVNVEMINLIITQFMEVGKMESTEDIRPTISFVDMEVVRDRVAKVGNRLRGENVEFVCVVSTAVPLSLFTDAEWVWQIMLNLLTNATKYTYSGYVRVLIDFKDDHLVITVTDTGIGIEDSEKENVFGKFTTRKNFGHDSHGIGLYSVKMKVDALGGSIRVADNPDPGGGSVFEVKIPVVVDRETRMDSEAGEDTARKTCLVIDDTPSIRKMMTRLLRKHDTETAVNGVAGLDMMKAREYDIVLLDMFMPVMDGLECIKKFRSWESENRSRSRRQIIYSMSANQHELDDRFDGALPKPIDGKRLSALIDRL